MRDQRRDPRRARAPGTSPRERAPGSASRRQAELRRHILIAAEIIAAAKAADQGALADAQARWRQNADTIAALLNRVNPRHWKRAAPRAMLGEHLRLATDEAVARLQGDWEADVRAYDRVHRHALGMADALSAGLIAQLPSRFRAA